MVPKYQLNYILAFSVTQAKEVPDGPLSLSAISRPSLVFKAHVLSCPVPVYSLYSPHPPQPHTFQLGPTRSQRLIANGCLWLFCSSWSSPIIISIFNISVSLTNKDDGLGLSMQENAFYPFPPQIAKLTGPFRICKGGKKLHLVDSSTNLNSFSNLGFTMRVK